MLVSVCLVKVLKLEFKCEIDLGRMDYVKVFESDELV